MKVEVALVGGKRFCGYSFTDRIEVTIVPSPVVEDNRTTYNGTVCYDTDNGACGRKVVSIHER